MKIKVVKVFFNALTGLNKFLRVFLTFKVVIKYYFLSLIIKLSLVSCDNKVVIYNSYIGHL